MIIHTFLHKASTSGKFFLNFLQKVLARVLFFSIMHLTQRRTVVNDLD